jgi:hypothetical protein
MPEQIFMKLGTYITAPEPISTAYFIHPSHQSVCLYVYPPIVAVQRLCRNVTAVTNTHATIGELLDASFSMWPVSYQGKYAISSSQTVFVCLFVYDAHFLALTEEADVGGHRSYKSVRTAASIPHCCLPVTACFGRIHLI